MLGRRPVHFAGSLFNHARNALEKIVGTRSAGRIFSGEPAWLGRKRSATLGDLGYGTSKNGLNKSLRGAVAETYRHQALGPKIAEGFEVQAEVASNMAGEMRATPAGTRFQRAASNWKPAVWPVS